MSDRPISKLNNKPLSEEQQAAFDASCEVVSQGRAKELVRLSKWKNGGCLTIRKRPEIEEVTTLEDEAIKRFWMTLPGWTSWSTSLELLSEDPRQERVEGGQDR